MESSHFSAFFVVLNQDPFIYFSFLEFSGLGAWVNGLAHSEVPCFLFIESIINFESRIDPESWLQESSSIVLWDSPIFQPLLYRNNAWLWKKINTLKMALLQPHSYSILLVSGSFTFSLVLRKYSVVLRQSRTVSMLGSMSCCIVLKSGYSVKKLATSPAVHPVWRWTSFKCP